MVAAVWALFDGLGLAEGQHVVGIGGPGIERQCGAASRPASPVASACQQEAGQGVGVEEVQRRAVGANAQFGDQGELGQAGVDGDHAVVAQEVVPLGLFGSRLTSWP